MRIEDIVIGERVRRDMGDLSTLAESMMAHGLLHPVVVKSDGTLIAGHRRIEAAKLNGWSDIPVTVIDVADLISAERDENAERKDFTPTEAIAIGRLIEDRHRELIQADSSRRHKLVSDIRNAKRAGDTSALKQLAGESAPLGRTLDVAAKGVGMGASQYQKAREVVVAAECDPQQFGDLPEAMDESRNVHGTHRELVRRKTGSGRGNPALNKMRHLQPNREIERAIVALEGICHVLKELKVAELDADKLDGWAKALAKSASIIKSTSRRVYGKK